jgi:serine/threonine protein kinase
MSEGLSRSPTTSSWWSDRNNSAQPHSSDAFTDLGTETPDYLGLVDISALSKLQIILSSGTGRGHFLGSPASGLGCLQLGGGRSFSVRRVMSSSVSRFIDSFDETFDKKNFVVIKQPRLSKLDFSKDDDFPARLSAVMMELKILHHDPIRKHQNIVHMHSFIWDAQDDPTVLAPSLIMEYADLGTLSDYLSPARVPQPVDVKAMICLDAATGLFFLHSCGVIHGDVKSELVPPVQL